MDNVSKSSRTCLKVCKNLLVGTFQKIMFKIFNFTECQLSLIPKWKYNFLPLTFTFKDVKNSNSAWTSIRKPCKMRFELNPKIHLNSPIMIQTHMFVELASRVSWYGYGVNCETRNLLVPPWSTTHVHNITPNLDAF